MPVAKDKAAYYAASNVWEEHSLDTQLARQRAQRLLDTWKILNRTWNEYLARPVKLPAVIWNQIKKRFELQDMATTVLETIQSATFSSPVHVEITNAVHKDKLIVAMKQARFDDFLVKWSRESFAYGTSFGAFGRDRKNRWSLTLQPSISTDIVTPVDDVNDVEAVVVYFRNLVRSYEPEGIYELRKGDGVAPGVAVGEWKPVPNTNFGFIPVAVARGRHMDCTTPYGESLIWPAVAASKQVTFLDADLMVLEKQQAYSTLVIKGKQIDVKKDMIGGPWAYMSLDPTDPNADAKFINPQAAIEKVDDVIRSKYQRCASECNVPVEVFMGAKSGTNQKTGAALLTHKPLYDLVQTVQQGKKCEITELVAIMDARIGWEESGGVPQDLESYRERLELEITFENEINPAFTPEEVQMHAQAVDEGFEDFPVARKRFSPKSTKEETERAQRERDERRRAEIAPPVVEPTAISA